MSEEWTPFVIAGLGIFALIYAFRILQTGEIQGEGGALSRSKSPLTYWFLLIFILLSGLGLTAAGLFMFQTGL